MQLDAAGGKGADRDSSDTTPSYLGLRHRVTIVTSLESVASTGDQLFVRLLACTGRATSRRAAAADDLLAFHLERRDPFVDRGEA